MLHFFNKIALFLAIPSVLYIAFISYRSENPDTRTPIIMSHVETLNSPAQIGEPIRVKIHRTKVRKCDAVTSIRMVIDEDGKATPVNDLTHEGGPINEPWVVFAYDVGVLEPGNYELKVTLYYHCEDKVHRVEQPSARFRVVL